MEQGKMADIGYVAGSWPLDPDRVSLVFIHGAGGTSALWSAQVDGLSSRANTIALDLPGHGASPGPGCKSVPDYARLVVDFLDRARVPGPIPVGLSMGGAIAQQLLLDYPDRLRAGVLVSTGARLRVMPQIFQTIERDFSAYVELIGKFAVSAKTDPARIRPLLEETARQEPTVIINDFRACDAFSVMERLSEIRLPVLVVSAADDLLTPPKYGDYLANNIPGARRVHILDAGHMVPAERPREFNRGLEGFLDELGL